MNNIEDCMVIKSADIHTKGRPPEDILSNLCGNDFCFDDVQCGCMESFLRALNYRDMELQRKICFMTACVEKPEQTGTVRRSRLGHF